MECKYEMLFDWTLSTICNLNCKYCIVKNSSKNNYFKNNIIGNIISEYNLKRQSKKMEVIDISNLLLLVEKYGKTIRLNMSGGEPFLVPNFIDICLETTKKHYISIVTNMTSDRVKLFCDTVAPEKVISICSSFHFQELEKRNLIDRYLSNYLYCKEKGFYIFSVIVAHPGLTDKIIEYKAKLEEKGLEVYCVPYLGNYKGKEYPNSYTNEELGYFNIERDRVQTRYSKEKECTAGYNFFIIDKLGDIYPCYHVKEKIGNIYEGFIKSDSLMTCPTYRCNCHPKLVDKNLYEISMSNRFAPS